MESKQEKLKQKETIRIQDDNLREYRIFSVCWIFVVLILFCILPSSAISQEKIVPTPDNFDFGPEPGDGQPFFPEDVGYDAEKKEYQRWADNGY